MQIIHPLNTYGNPPNLIPLRVKSSILILIFFVLSFSLVGCVSFNDPEASQEFNSETVGKLNTQSIIGQSFISRRPNLDGITIWITSSSTQEELPVNDGEHVINIKLFDSKNATLPVFATNIVLAATGNTTPFAIQIPNQNNLANERYLIQLSTEFKHDTNSGAQ